MKQKLLFVIESLVCAGAEKSLVTLLNQLDYSRYDVDLQLFAYNGEFQSLVPDQVHILPVLPYFASTSQSLISTLIHYPKDGIYRLRYSVSLRCGKYNNPQKAILFWKSTHSRFFPSEKQYDIAIAYAQGTPTFYVADCISAKKKFAWVNVTYKPAGKWREYISQYYEKFDNIVCVSDSTEQIFHNVFPEHASKSKVILDINDYAMIQKMSMLASDVDADMSYPGMKILTVGRFAPQKGYDIAVEACRILKERGLKFHWYALGRGALEKEIRASMEEKGIADCFTLLGTRANPYPYFAKADLYVHTAKFEGFGLTIAEARMLNVPVVTTRFDAVYAQMVENENGLVVDIDPVAVADGIQRLMEDRTLYEHIRQYLMHEKKGNTEEIEKFYGLIEE